MHRFDRVVVAVLTGLVLPACAPEPPTASRVYFPGCTQLAGHATTVAALEGALREGLGEARAERAGRAWTLECIVEAHDGRAVARLRLFSAPDAHPMWSGTFSLEPVQREAAAVALGSAVQRLRSTRAPAPH